jgi:hypothetical protein
MEVGNLPKAEKRLHSGDRLSITRGLRAQPESCMSLMYVESRQGYLLATETIITYWPPAKPLAGRVAPMPVNAG